MNRSFTVLKTTVPMVALLALTACATQPVVTAATPAAPSPASCPHSPVALRVLGEDNEPRRWYLDELTKRNVTINPIATTMLEIDEPVVEDRRGEACLVLAARLSGDGQEFAAQRIEVTRCVRGPADAGAQLFLLFAGLAAGIATARTPDFPPNPRDAPIIGMRTELVERITRSCR